MSKINVIATLHVTNHAKASVKNQMKKLVELSRAEPGCLRYDFYQVDKDGVAGMKNTGGDFVVIESWKNTNALISHAESNHFSSFVTAFSKDEMSITLQLIDEI
ncbi:MAG: putative quinol monooxygenase [Pseudomonadales bacterium]